MKRKHNLQFKCFFFTASSLKNLTANVSCPNEPIFNDVAAIWEILPLVSTILS